MRPTAATVVAAAIATGVWTQAAIPAARATYALTSAHAAEREVTLPAGTLIPVMFDASVGSDISRVEQPVRAHVTRAVVLNGATVIPRGSRVKGVVTSARRSGKVKGRAYVAVRFTELEPASEGGRYSIATRPIGRTAPATKKQDAIKIGAPAAGGAAVGALLGGRKGAAIGATVGGSAGTAVVLDTRGKEVRFAKGSTTSVRLTAPVTIRVAR